MHGPRFVNLALQRSRDGFLGTPTERPSWMLLGVLWASEMCFDLGNGRNTLAMILIIETPVKSSGAYDNESAHL